MARNNDNRQRFTFHSGSGNRFFDMASTSTLTAVTVVFEQPPAT
jgi:hypothetical protein